MQSILSKMSGSLKVFGNTIRQCRFICSVNVDKSVYCLVSVDFCWGNTVLIVSSGACASSSKFVTNF